MQRENAAPLETIGYRAPMERASRVRYQVMGFLGVLAFLTYFDRVCIMRAQEDIQRDLNLTTHQMGYVFGAFWFAYALFEIPGGWLADRFGARSALTRIVLAWSLFTALSGSATGFMSLVAYRFLFGVGEAGAYPSMARVQSNWLPLEARARAGGMLWLFSRWGAAFSGVLFGLLLRFFDSPSFRTTMADIPGLRWAANTASWRLGFWAAGFLGSFWVLFFFWWFRDKPSQKATVNQAEMDLIQAGRPPQDSSEDHDPKILGQIFTSPILWLFGLIAFCLSFGFSFVVSWLPKYLKDVHHLEFRKSEWNTAGPMFFAGIACVIGGYIADAYVKRTGNKRVGRAMLPITGMLVAAASLFALRYVRTPGQATALICIAYFAFDIGQGPYWATIVDIGGKYAAMAFGFINMVGNFANAAGPRIGSAVFENLGWNFLMATYAGAFLIVAVAWLFIDPTTRFYKDRPPPRGFEPQNVGSALRTTGE